MRKAVQISGLILIIQLAVSGGYYAGRKSVKPVDEETFYDTIEEIREKDIMVQGLEINDINKRRKFQLSIDEDTKLVWRGIPITLGDDEGMVSRAEALEKSVSLKWFWRRVSVFSAPDLIVRKKEKDSGF